MSMHFLRPTLAVAVVNLLFVSTAFCAQSDKSEKVVKDGVMVSLQYTLAGEDGKVMESNKGKEPLKYVHGKGMMIPGLERELTGMKVGQEKHVKVKPEDAYGRVDPKGFQEIPKEKIPPEVWKEIKVGSMLPAKNPDGQVVGIPVTEVKDQSIVVNMNHPMAGKTLVFDVKILDVQPAQVPQSAQPSPPAQPAQPAKPAQPGQPKK